MAEVEAPMPIAAKARPDFMVVVVMEKGPKNESKQTTNDARILDGWMDALFPFFWGSHDQAAHVKKMAQRWLHLRSTSLLQARLSGDRQPEQFVSLAAAAAAGDAAVINPHKRPQPPNDAAHRHLFFFSVFSHTFCHARNLFRDLYFIDSATPLSTS